MVTTAEGRGPFFGETIRENPVPMLGRLEDCDDPLIFLEKCYDFMALHAPFLLKNE